MKFGDITVFETAVVRHLNFFKRKHSLPLFWSDYASTFKI